MGITAALIAAHIALLHSCKDQIIAATNAVNTSTIGLTYVTVPQVYDISVNQELRIAGKGFLPTDIITMVPTNNAAKAKECRIKAVDQDGILLFQPEELADGRYELYVKRNTLTELLGRTYINRVFNSAIPDLENMTVKGTVYSQNKGLANVQVSDGELVTTTDINGVYYLPSKKKNGYVFITVPANYEVATVNTVPQFYKNLLSISAQAEVRDFELFPVNNEHHAIAFLADIHLANRNDDLTQFQNGFVNDLKETVADIRSQNKKFYAFTLGDQSWDAYWYENKFGLKEYLNQVKDFDFPIFNTIGNHDNDPYFANDWLAESSYRTILGPTYYSVNIGKVHYIVLDNMIYQNFGGSMGILGDRSFKNEITLQQMEWLKKDLALVKDKTTPIVVAMHVPLHTNPNLNSYGYNLENETAFLAALQEFANVKILSGHTHINYRVEANRGKLSEHTIAAVSATWWWTGRTGYAGNHICKDGSPGGYSIWHMDGAAQQWYYKSIGYPKNYQFRAYDLNTVQITATAHTPNANADFKAKVASYAGEYAAKRTSNEVLLNIWGYQQNWKISVQEEGAELVVQQVHKKDPLHIISYATQRLNVNADPTSTFVGGNTSHLFLTKASKENSTLLITVEDSFGNVYTEKMIRPKPFTYTMR